MRKLFFTMISVFVMCFLICSCGSSDSTDSAQQGSATDAEASLSKIDYQGSSYDELSELYKVELDGKQYSLPCSLNDFTDNGYIIPDDYVNTTIDASSVMAAVPVYTDASASQPVFSLEVSNLTGESKPFTECIVSGISLSDKDYNPDAVSSITLLKAGVTIDVSDDDAARESAEKLKAVYGTDEDIFTGTDYEEGNFDYSWRFCQRTGSGTVKAKDCTTITKNLFLLSIHGLD